MKLTLIGYVEKLDIPHELLRHILLNEFCNTDVSGHHPQIVYDDLKDWLHTDYEGVTDNLVLLSANEHLFNIVGNMIAAGQIDLDEWTIEVSYYSEKVSIVNTTYDKEGFLIKWPYGAFDFVIDEDEM